MNGTVLAAGDLEVVDEQLGLAHFAEQHVLVACPGCAPAGGHDLEGTDCPGLLYAWRDSSRLEIGDRVVCPPTPRTADEWATLVIATNTIGVPWPGYIKDILRRWP